MKASAESKAALLSLGSLRSAPSLAVASGGSEAAMGAGGMAASTALKVRMHACMGLRSDGMVSSLWICMDNIRYIPAVLGSYHTLLLVRKCACVCVCVIIRQWHKADKGLLSTHQTLQSH